MSTGETPELYVQIHDLLYSLGVTAKYTGFFHTSYAVYLTIQQPERLLLVTKWLYPDVAKHYGTNWRNVEKSIRTAAGVAWKLRPDKLSVIARYDLDHRPNNSCFIAILADYLQSPSDIVTANPLPLIS